MTPDNADPNPLGADKGRGPMTPVQIAPSHAGPDDHRPTVPAGGLGPTLPARLLRLLLTVAGSLTVAAVAVLAKPSPLFLTLLICLALASVVQPATHLPTVFLAACFWSVLRHDDGVTGWTALAVLGAHATHVLAALAAVIPWGTRFERAALRPSLDRFVLVQVASQLLVLLAWLISPT